MKKLFSCILTIVILICFSLTAFAGSVPEDLLYEDFSQVFFAEVVECKTTVSGEDSYVKVIPVKTVKGDIELGIEAVYEYPRPVGAFTPCKGYAYLFTYFDENNPTYVFRASDYDTKSLELTDIKEDNNMWQQFEEYLNEGRYEKAEAERKARLGSAETDSQISGELPTLHTPKHTYTFICALCLICAAAVIGLVIYKRKRNKNS